MKEQSYLSVLRQSIVKQYQLTNLDCVGDFGQILCHEIHTGNLDFIRLAKKWGISLPTLGELIKDHCLALEPLPVIDHNYKIEGRKI